MDKTTKAPEAKSRRKRCRNTNEKFNERHEELKALYGIWQETKDPKDEQTYEALLIDLTMPLAKQFIATNHLARTAQDFEDLFQDCMQGVHESVRGTKRIKRYDPNIAKPSSYFSNNIFRQCTREGKEKTGGIPQHYASTYIHIMDVCKKYHITDPNELPVEDLARLIGASPKTVQETLRICAPNSIISLDSYTDNHDFESPFGRTEEVAIHKQTMRDIRTAIIEALTPLQQYILWMDAENCEEVTDRQLLGLLNGELHERYSDELPPKVTTVTIRQIRSEYRARIFRHHSMLEYRDAFKMDDTYEEQEQATEEEIANAMLVMDIDVD